MKRPLGGALPKPLFSPLLSFWLRPHRQSITSALCFSPALCAPPRCQSPAPPSRRPRPPAPASGGARTDRPVLPGRVRHRRCCTSTRSTRGSVRLGTYAHLSCCLSNKLIKFIVFLCFSALVPRPQPYFPQHAGGVAGGGGHYRIHQRLLQRRTTQSVSVVPLLQEKKKIPD